MKELSNWQSQNSSPKTSNKTHRTKIIAVAPSCPPRIVQVNTMDEQERWKAYLDELRRSDPEEYAALVQDIGALAEQQQKQQEIVLTQDEETVAEEFTPKLPGGKRMTETGVTEDFEAQKGETIVPEPGFVVKTRSEKEEKVFINVCQSSAIQKACMKKQLANDGTEQEGLHVPLSLGPPRLDEDKTGKPCIVYDVIVNPELLVEAKEDKSGGLRATICEVILQYVEQKYKQKLDYRFKLPKLQYKGDKSAIPAQMVRKQKKPVIEEVSDSNDLQQKPVEAKSQVKPVAISYALFKVMPDQSRRLVEARLSEPAECVTKPDFLRFVLEADLERVTRVTKSKIMVEIGTEMVLIRVDGLYLPLDVFLPFPVNSDSGKAKFAEASRKLFITLEPEKDLEKRTFWNFTSEPDPGSRAWLLQHAISRDDDEVEITGSDDKNMEAKSTPNPAEDHDGDSSLAEDRFHLSDLLSQHIKDERERERKAKIKQHDEEEQRKQKETEDRLAKEKQRKIQEILKKAERELAESRGERHDSYIMDNEDMDLL